MAHGVLFMLFVTLLGLASKKYGFSLKYSMILFVASLVPFGTFFTDKQLKELSLAKV